MTNRRSGVLLQGADEDLYRLGNSTSSRLDHVREETDVQTYERNGVKFVRATSEGISLLSEERAALVKRGGWLWKLPARLPLPIGLVLNNDRPGHFALCPASDMTIDEYRTLLSKVAGHCERIKRL